ncbi:MAG: ABC transporter ATP-binding protein [Rikenellaceae bacterium]|nr:ABC transporter ATP-binding protein [Rikenellaceae bacterium]
MKPNTNGRLLLVEISDMSVSYGTEEVLHNVNLRIYGDDFLGVVGPNGGGKTTLIKAVLGAVPYSGHIEYHPEIKGRHGSIGYLPQINSFARNFPITILDVVLSGLQGRKGFSGEYKPEDREKASELLSEMGISGIRKKAICEVSGGQMQRALLCRALIPEPRLLILDEPANFVDNDFERELYEILRGVNEKIAIIMVSHDLGTISSVVKNIVCVNKKVHRHNSNEITYEQLANYNCPIQILHHDEIPHTVLGRH